MGSIIKDRPGKYESPRISEKETLVTRKMNANLCIFQSLSLKNKGNLVGLDLYDARDEIDNGLNGI